MTQLEDLRHTETVQVAAPPEAVYAVVSDVTRTGEWSPTCRQCRWEEGDGPVVGAVFVGRNETPDRTWETRSTVTAAEPGRAFAWHVAAGWVRWRYELEPAEGGTRLTQHWEVTPTGVAGFEERYGEEAWTQLEQRRQSAVGDMPRSLATIKEIAERETA